MIINQTKMYCLKCKKPSAICKGHDEFKFSYTDKLRVPTDITKRSEFRKFLDTCPEFVNCVEDTQQEMFKNLLREVKYFNKSINGKDWTNIKK